MRADLALVARGLAPSRSAAQRLIAAGAVRVRGLARGQAHGAVAGRGNGANDGADDSADDGGWAVLRKASEELREGTELQLADDAETRWVSRGGLKLDGSLTACGIDPAGSVALDLGQSTGGFTEVLLARGAAQVIGIDVGHGQLHPRLAGDPRVCALEGLNARQLDAADLAARVQATGRAGHTGHARHIWPAAGFSFACADLSFISLTLVLPALRPLLAPGADLLALVKPQFELQPADIGKGGLVRDPAAHARVEARLREACAACGLAVQRWLDSPITGGDGNREFFLHARPA